jgi:DNA-binding winged helix-turn-helix (wHTH) protein
MDTRGSADVLLFDGFRFDRRGGGCLFRLDEVGGAQPVPRCGRALALLCLLLERHGEAVPKDEIMNMVWRGRTVEEANLNVQIGRLRHILDERRECGSCIQTITGYGYRFVAPMTPESHAPTPTFPDDNALSRPGLLIIALPFAGLSEDFLRQYFAAAITGNLTVDLSQLARILRIPQHPAAARQDRAIEIQRITRAKETEC